MTCGPWPERAMADLGESDSVEQYLADWKNSHKFSQKGRAGEPEVGDTAWIQRMCELFAETFTWTSEVAKVNWEPFPNAGWYPMPTWETVAPRQWRATTGIVPPIKALVDTYDDSETVCGMEVYDLIQDSSGRIIGVRAVDEGGKRIVAKASKAVILTTGTFMNDRHMVGEYLPAPAIKLPPGGCVSVTGDGHKMIQRIGGAFKGIDMGVHCFGKTLWTEKATMITSWTFVGDYFGKFLGSIPGVLINLDGKRYIAESLGYNITAQTTMFQRDSVGFYIVDSQSTANLVPDDLTDDLFLTADTLEGLASLIHVDADTLTSEIAKYNSYVDSGTDADFDKVMDGCPRLEQGPFYALPIRPMPYATYGGIDVDVDSHVLDTTGSVIPGLYAAGICCGSFAAQAGVFYTGGVVQTCTFGRQAGRLAAGEESWG